MAGELDLDLELALAAIPGFAGYPAAKRSKRCLSAAAAAAAAADSAPSVLALLSDCTEAASEFALRLEAARPQVLCAGSAEAGGRCGMAIAAELLAAGCISCGAAGRCSTVAGGGRAAPERGLGGGGLDRV